MNYQKPRRITKKLESNSTVILSYAIQKRNWETGELIPKKPKRMLKSPTFKTQEIHEKLSLAEIVKTHSKNLRELTIYYMKEQDVKIKIHIARLGDRTYHETFKEEFNHQTYYLGHYIKINWLKEQVNQLSQRVVEHNKLFSLYEELSCKQISRNKDEEERFNTFSDKYREPYEFTPTDRTMLVQLEEMKKNRWSEAICRIHGFLEPKNKNTKVFPNYLKKIILRENYGSADRADKKDSLWAREALSAEDAMLYIKKLLKQQGS